MNAENEWLASLNKGGVTVSVHTCCHLTIIVLECSNTRIDSLHYLLAFFFKKPSRLDFSLLPFESSSGGKEPVKNASRLDFFLLPFESSSGEKEPVSLAD